MVSYSLTSSFCLFLHPKLCGHASTSRGNQNASNILMHRVPPPEKEGIKQLARPVCQNDSIAIHIFLPNIIISEQPNLFSMSLPPFPAAVATVLGPDTFNLHTLHGGLQLASPEEHNDSSSACHETLSHRSIFDHGPYVKQAARYYVCCQCRQGPQSTTLHPRCVHCGHQLCKYCIPT